MPSSSSLLSLAAKLFKAASPSPLPPAAAPYRCFSVKAIHAAAAAKARAKEAAAAAAAAKGKAKAAAAAAKGKVKPLPAASAEKKPKKIVPQPVYKVSSGLSGVLQVSETTRPDALKRLWIYVKAHNLQSASDRTQIVCDLTLKKAFGQDNLKLTEVLKCLNPHLTRKV